MAPSISLRSIISFCGYLSSLGVLAAATPNFAPTLAVGISRAAQGTATTLPLRLQNAPTAVASQLEVQYDSSRAQFTGASVSQSGRSLIVRSREISPGVQRILTYSYANAPQGANSSLAHLGYALNPNATKGSGDITPIKAELVDADGRNIKPVVGQSGYIFVDPVEYDAATQRSVVMLSTLPEREYVIQASMDFVQWQNIATNTAMAEFLRFVDQDASKYPHRFYRPIELDDLPSPGRIQEVTVNPNGSLRIAVVAQPKNKYQLQSSPDLINWSDVSVHEAQSSTLELSVNRQVPDGHLFFRIRPLP